MHMHKLKLDVAGLDAASAARFEELVLGVEGASAVDTWPGRAEISIDDTADAAHLLAVLKHAGFVAKRRGGEVCTFAVDGMTCRSCEITIERALRKVTGVDNVHADATRGIITVESDTKAPSLTSLRKALGDRHYVIKDGDVRSRGQMAWIETVLLFAAAYALIKVFANLDFASTAMNDGAVGFLAVVVIGLLAGSSSCIAVSGGLMLSMVGKYRATRGHTEGSAMIPVAAFIGGRVAAYALLGGVIALIGRSLAPSAFATGIITVVVAIVMVVMGLDMLGLAPGWLLRMMPRMPKKLAHRVVDAQESGQLALPALLGAATFFIPCGFTQALQLYALTAGSFSAGAMMLGGFALGTAPALAALGWMSAALQGHAGRIFIRFSGALVLLLGLWSAQNGLVAAGVSPLFVARDAVSVGTAATVVDGVQQVTLTLTDSEPYYSPNSNLTVRQGIPVRLEIIGPGYGCRTQFQIPKFGISVPLLQRSTVVEFTPDATGVATFSCSMGMYPGTITVING